MSVRTVDIAYDYLNQKKTSVSFKELWEVVTNALGFDEKTARNKISHFYTDLTMDGRFTSGENNTWDLKSNSYYEEIELQEEDPEEEGDITDEEDDVDATIEDEY